MLTIRFDQLGLAPGDRVLDVGAGFGRHVFECARRGADVVALDYAEDEVVQTRAILGGMVDAGEIDLERFKGVLRGDATKLPFADNSFDVVVAQYVITAVPDPDAALDEFARVLKPGGEIILVNHISAEGGMRRAFELKFAPIARRLGWRPEFEWSRLQAWIDRRPNMKVVDKKPMPPLGHFSMIRFRKAA